MPTNWFVRLLRAIFWRKRITPRMRLFSWHLLGHRDAEGALMQEELSDPKCRARIYWYIRQAKKSWIVGEVRNPSERLKAFGVAHFFVDEIDQNGRIGVIVCSNLCEACRYALMKAEGNSEIREGNGSEVAYVNMPNHEIRYLEIRTQE